MINEIFSPMVLETAEAWHQNAIITGRKFHPIDPPHRIRGDNKPRWVGDNEGHVGVAKRTGRYKAAVEKIVSELAHAIKFPVPPVQIWKETDPERERFIYFNCVSLRPFENSRPSPPPSVMLASSHFLVSPIFDQWVKNKDRYSTSIIYDRDAPKDDPHVAFPDNDKAFSLAIPGVNGVLRCFDTLVSTPQSVKLANKLQEGYMQSKDVNEFLGRIEGVSNAAIGTIVSPYRDLLVLEYKNRKSGEIVTLNKTDEIIDTLCQRRDIIRDLTAKSLRLYK